MIFAVIKHEGVTYVREPSGRWGILGEGSLSVVSNDAPATTISGYYPDAATPEQAKIFDATLRGYGHSV